ncbi:MAG TPA: LuxR C-terminal-related transcriptional regulator [Rugosimonospora sp.]|nr:LuxR C-terminal-related transcriptional regulator [Rugosimonospora sp.]
MKTLESGHEPLFSVAVQCRNRFVRELLASHLGQDREIALLGFVSSGSELVELCNVRRPTVAIFEADAPRWSNERLISLLRPPGRAPRVIGMHESLPAVNIVRAYEAGVNALVPYAAGLGALVNAVKVPSLVEKVQAERGRAGLTPRELEVLYLISAGYPSEQAAWLLGITPYTLEHHKRQIFAKLGAHDQAHAVASAMRLGLSQAPARPLARPDRSGSHGSYLRVLVHGGTDDLIERIRKVLDHPDMQVAVDGEETPPPRWAKARKVTVAVVEGPGAVDRTVHSGRGPLVLVLTGEGTRDQVANAWAQGTAVVRAADVEDLLQLAVRAASHGHLLVEAAHAKAILGPPSGGMSTLWRVALTPREREILGHVWRGYTMKQTARVLGISVRTVENLQSNLFRKLGVHSRSAALTTAVELGLLDDLNLLERRLTGDDVLAP